MHPRDLSGRVVALLGLGSDVRAAVPTIMAAGPREVVVVDDGLSGGVTIGEYTFRVVPLAEASAAAEAMVRSPGYPRYLPELVEARRRGVAMTTPVDLFLAALPPEVVTVLVTGTKGKSTTTELIGRFARQAGIEVGVAGNLGVPVFEPGWGADAPIVVLEVSSYQASDLHHAPDVAVITSIAEDHLSWHGGLETYLEDKLRVVDNDAGRAAEVLVPAAETRAREVLAERFPDLEPLLVDEPASDDAIPAHRLRNAALAARVVEELGGPAPDTAQVLSAASGSLPGRLDVCAAADSTGGVVFVDDALASNPSATAAGLAWARANSNEVVVVLGGHARGVSDAPLRDEARRWNEDPRRRLRAVVVPESGAELARSCGIEVLAEVDDLAAAVHIAHEALRGGPGGPMVIFSPAAPTPPGSGNWETRSEQFRDAVSSLAAS